MAQLALYLLGTFQLTLDGKWITRFRSDKLRALLAYLAVESGRPHRREVLAGLFWPDYPDQVALSNLRKSLHLLRQAIGYEVAAGAPLLTITRQAVQLNPMALWLDVAEFQALLTACEAHMHRHLHDCRPCMERLTQAVRLYQGEFLAGFSLTGTLAFDEWVLIQREMLHQQALAALGNLAAAHEQCGEYDQARACAARQVALEPWREEAHRQLMRALTLSGQRNAALVQYETCRRVLAAELGVEPVAETTALYESIRDGTLEAPTSAPALPPLPPFLSYLGETRLAEKESPVFVAREHELAELDRFLASALAGQGRVVFVTGDAGSGKTALVGEFTRRGMAAHGDVIAATGHCNAHTGIGDPYLPFREIVQMLTGDIEARWAGGAITQEHARRLWALLPAAAQALMDSGPDLIDLFVSGEALLTRAQMKGAWLARLEELIKRKAAGPAPAELQQTDLFDQVTNVLQALARQHPLILVLDDLQWADTGSISLLFHLGRRLAGSRIIIIGAYRPEDVALGRDGERHPLEPIVNELQRECGDIEVDLDQAEGRQFVDAFLDSEPNRLGAAFRKTLYRHTGGHALFTVELLRGLQERGDLLRDETGQWVERPIMDWEKLPARVEAVIAERISRLPQEWQAMLAAASVEGEEFIAEVVASVLGTDEGEIVRHLSGELSKQHRLVVAQSVQRLDGQRLSHYRFRHYLFQRYLYQTLDEVERAHLHEAIGNVLEALYGESVAEVTVQLAWHFEAAGVVDKAVDYLLQAGNQAVRLSAYNEAITHFTRGLALLETLPESPERAQQELALQLALGAPLLAMQGWGTPEHAHACIRAYELCQQIGGTTQFLQALFLLADMCRAQGEHQKSLDLGEQLFSLAERTQDPQQIALAHWALGETRFFRGELTLAREHLAQASTLHDPRQHRSLTSLTGPDTGVTCLAWLSWALWSLGYPDQAWQRSQEALTLAQELDHPLTLAFAMTFASCGFHLLRRETQAAQEGIEALVQLVTTNGLTTMQPWATILQGWGQARQGQVEEGIMQMRAGMDTWRTMGAVSGQSFQVLPLAETYWRTGRAGEGVRVLDETLDMVEKTVERCLEAELYRLKGELLLAQGDGEEEAKACYRQAIAVARQQMAKSWELRAAMSLCRLWQRQGKQAEAYQMLEEIYSWFTEGFDTPDLQEARGLLEELPSMEDTYATSR
jgi:DNA-binding SARP family transcriptional activator/predicted ATPase